VNSSNFRAVVPVDRSIFWRTATLVSRFFFFAVAAWRRFSLPQDPLADTDFGYLWPALMKLDGGSFRHIQGLNFLYPSIVYLILRIFSDFRAVTLIHTLPWVGRRHPVSRDLAKAG
jgi:hypothetical protein